MKLMLAMPQKKRKRLNRGDCMSEQENPYETIKNNNHNNNNNNKEKYEMNVNEDTF